MAGVMDLDIKGLDEIERRLKELPEKLRRKTLRAVLTDGAETIRADAARRARRAGPPTWPDSGHLADSIVKKVTVTDRYASARVGINWEKIRHGHLVEFGTKPHKVGKRRHPGARKRPFMRPAFDENGESVLNTMITDLAKAVEDNA